MDLKIKDKVALVTGSSNGIGFAIAKELANEGAIVFVNGRNADRVDEAIKLILSQNPKAKLKPLVADLSDPKEIEKTFQKIPSVDILVNNLGIYEIVPFDEITDEKWQHLFEVNVLSGIRLSRHYLKPMLHQNSGRIVFISSESGIMIPSEMIHYGFTKTSQLALAQGLAQLTKGTKVTVNSVLPGPTWTEGVEKFIAEGARAKGISPKQMEDDFFKTMRPSSLLQRFIKPEEIASLVAYVCSPLSAATNGAALKAEGGLVRSVI